MKEIKKNDEKYSNLLKRISNSPKKILAMGNTELLNSNCISIIGARECSEEGFKLAKKFSKELSKNGFCIVSGMAVGIDTAAHIGALEATGETIAVLPCGFNNIFPKENEELFKDIVKSGLAITEYEENTKANSKKFVERNRIVSGLSIATLVIEACYRSGTSITAKLAMAEKRKVFCIPHEIHNKYGVGTNELIRRGAILVTSVEQIIEEFPNLIEKREFKPKKEINNVSIDRIKPEYRSIYKILRGEKLTIDIISRKLKLDVSKVNSLLTLMELEGLVEELPGKEFKCTNHMN